MGEEQLNVSPTVALLDDDSGSGSLLIATEFLLGIVDDGYLETSLMLRKSMRHNATTISKMNEQVERKKP